MSELSDRSERHQFSCLMQLHPERCLRLSMPPKVSLYSADERQLSTSAMRFSSLFPDLMIYESERIAVPELSWLFLPPPGIGLLAELL